MILLSIVPGTCLEMSVTPPTQSAPGDVLTGDILKSRLVSSRKRHKLIFIRNQKSLEMAHLNSKKYSSGMQSWRIIR